MRGAVLVSDAGGLSAVFDLAHVPVLAPYAWLRRADSLPHSWQVTSDSIAAWIARALGARRLVLVKPPGFAPGPGSVVATSRRRARASTTRWFRLTRSRRCARPRGPDCTISSQHVPRAALLLARDAALA